MSIDKCVCVRGRDVIWLKPMEKPSVFTTLRKFLGFPVAQWSRTCRSDPGRSQTEESGGPQSMAGLQKSWAWLRHYTTTKNPNNKGLGSNETKITWFSGARGGYPAPWPTLSCWFSVPRAPDCQACNPHCPSVSCFLQLWVRQQDGARHALTQAPQ